MITDPQLQRLARQLAPIIEALRPAPGFIGARYATDAGQSIPNNTLPPTIINFEDESYDPLDLVTTGVAWAFTCPVAGYYQVAAAVLFASTAAWALGEASVLYVYRDGSEHSRLAYRDTYGGASQLAHLAGVDVVACDAGDTLDVRVYQNSGGALGLFANALYNHVSIYRVG